MNANIIAFDHARKTTPRAAAIARAAVQGVRNNIVSIDEWKNSAHARRTASGVFFTTGVLLTYGKAA